MKVRPGKLIIEVRDRGILFKDIQYDKDKIEFDYSSKLLCSADVFKPAGVPLILT